MGKTDLDTFHYFRCQCKVLYLFMLSFNFRFQNRVNTLPLAFRRVFTESEHVKNYSYRI